MVPPRFPFGATTLSPLDQFRCLAVGPAVPCISALSLRSRTYRKFDRPTSSVQVKLHPSIRLWKEKASLAIPLILVQTQR